MDSSKTTPRPVPAPRPRSISEGVTFVDPISRRGHGPGLILLVDDGSAGLSIDYGVPSPLQKWGEEGYAVVEIARSAWQSRDDVLDIAAKELKSSTSCDTSHGTGLVSYDIDSWRLAAPLLQRSSGIAGVVVYADVDYLHSPSEVSVPALIHIAGKAPKTLTHTPQSMQYDYTDVKSAEFANPSSRHFNYAAEAVSHTRSLTFLKSHMKGPYFDLEAIWDEHTHYEFGDRSVEHTMNTMVEEPYVNHIPTITGGIGREALTVFYRDHFIFSNPDDAELELISRTVGIDRVVDEFVYKCTHDRLIDWLFPGIPPTNNRVEVPMMAVVNIRGDRLYHEHIHWDHASALRQVGCIPKHVVWNSSEARPDVDIVNGTHPQQPTSSVPMDEVLRLPVMGKETVMKLRDKNAVPSNEMFDWGVKRVR